MKSDFFDLEERLGRSYADMVIARIKGGCDNWNFKIQQMAFELSDKELKRHKKMWKEMIGGETTYQNDVLTISFHEKLTPIKALANALMAIDIFSTFAHIDAISEEMEKNEEYYDYLGVSDDDYEALQEEASYHYGDRKMKLLEYFGMEDSEINRSAVEEELSEKTFEIALKNADIEPEEYWFDIYHDEVSWRRITEDEKRESYFFDQDKEAYYESLSAAKEWGRE